MHIKAIAIASLRDASIAAMMPALVLATWFAVNQTLGGARPWSVSAIVLLLLLTTTATTDLLRGKIYNAATYPAILWALAINLIAGRASLATLGGVGATSSLLGGLMCFAIMAVSFAAAGGGGGDVKLATALGLLLGVEKGLASLVYAYLAAAAFSVCYLIALGALGSATWMVSSRFGLIPIPVAADPETAAIAPQEGPDGAVLRDRDADRGGSRGSGMKNPRRHGARPRWK